MTNYCFTLAYNLPSEVEKATEMLYRLNSNSKFRHLIVDLGFPLIVGDEIPKDLKKAKKHNTKLLKETCVRYGSEYIEMENIGVSQNWTQVYKHLKLADDDVLIGVDPDEHPKGFGWVKAMGDAIRNMDLGLCSLMMEDHVPLMSGIPYSEQTIEGTRLYFLPAGSLNWALIGISGKFLNKIKKIPFPEKAPRYGWIEAELYPLFTKHKMTWAVLADYMVEHTDYEHGHPGTSKLLREWKNQIVFKVEDGQMSFDEFLKAKKKK